MSLFRLILWGILLFFIIRFVMRFLYPLFQAGRMVQSKMRDMQQQMDKMQEQQNAPTNSKPTVKEGEYIDYEEVK